MSEEAQKKENKNHVQLIDLVNIFQPNNNTLYSAPSSKEIAEAMYGNIGSAFEYFESDFHLLMEDLENISDVNIRTFTSEDGRFCSFLCFTHSTASGEEERWLAVVIYTFKDHGEEVPEDRRYEFVPYFALNGTIYDELQTLELKGACCHTGYQGEKFSFVDAKTKHDYLNFLLAANAMFEAILTKKPFDLKEFTRHLEIKSLKKSMADFDHIRYRGSVDIEVIRAGENKGELQGGFGFYTHEILNAFQLENENIFTCKLEEDEFPEFLESYRDVLLNLKSNYACHFDAPEELDIDSISTFQNENGELISAIFYSVPDFMGIPREYFAVTILTPVADTSQENDAAPLQTPLFHYHFEVSGNSEDLCEPIEAICRCIDDKDEPFMLAAKLPIEFIASICYGESALRLMICETPVSPNKIQDWLSPDAEDTAYDRFKFLVKRDATGIAREIEEMLDQPPPSPTAPLDAFVVDNIQPN